MGKGVIFPNFEILKGEWMLHGKITPLALPR